MHWLDTLCVEKFAEIALSRTVKEIEANLCFAIFGKNSKIQNGRHFWGGEIFLKIANITFLRYPVESKISMKSLYLDTVTGDRSKFAIFAIFGKIFSKIPKMAAIFGEGKIFAKNCKTQICFYLLRYPVRDRKFRRNRSIRTVKEYRSKFVIFAIFGKKFENSKWPPFLGRGKFLPKIAKIANLLLSP